MSSTNSKSEDLKSLIGMSLQNKFSWKDLGNILEEMAPTLTEYKILVKVLLTELETFHQTKQIDILPEEKKVPENEMKTSETSNVDDKIEVHESEDQAISSDQEIQSQIFQSLENKPLQMCDNNRITKAQKEKIFKCDICTKSFKTQFEIKCHERFHAREKQLLYQCKICDKKFFPLANLKLHEAFHKYACKMCDKRFANQSRLNSHVRRKHHSSEKLERPDSRLGFEYSSPSSDSDS